MQYDIYKKNTSEIKGKSTYKIKLFSNQMNTKHTVHNSYTLSWSEVRFLKWFIPKNKKFFQHLRTLMLFYRFVFFSRTHMEIIIDIMLVTATVTIHFHCIKIGINIIQNFSLCSTGRNHSSFEQHDGAWIMTEFIIFGWSILLIQLESK